MAGTVAPATIDYDRAPVTFSPEAKEPIHFEPEAKEPILFEPEAKKPILFEPEAKEPIFLEPKENEPIFFNDCLRTPNQVPRPHVTYAKFRYEREKEKEPKVHPL